VSKPWVIVPLALLLLFAGAAAAVAQKKQEPLRTVHGEVVDKQDSPLPASVVYLKNLRTLTVKTYIADDDGRYRFSGLDPNVDYEIHAEHGDSASGKHTISSFDTRKEIVIHLKVDKKKNGK